MSLLLSAVQIRLAKSEGRGERILLQRGEQSRANERVSATSFGERGKKLSLLATQRKEVNEICRSNICARHCWPHCNYPYFH